VRPLVRFNVSVIVEQNGAASRVMPVPVPLHDVGAGGRRPAAGAGARSRAAALVNLEAVPAPAGRCRWCWPRLPGILLHEAIGHGLEGDFNRKGRLRSAIASVNA